MEIGREDSFKKFSYVGVLVVVILPKAQKGVFSAFQVESSPHMQVTEIGLGSRQRWLSTFGKEKRQQRRYLQDDRNAY